MKKMILLSTVLFLSYASFAQSDSAMSAKKDKVIQKNTIEMSKTDGVMMKNGSMMNVEKGKLSNMTSDLVCKNGTRVTSNGSVSKTDGSRMMMKEGEYMDASGKVMALSLIHI